MGMASGLIYGVNRPPCLLLPKGLNEMWDTAAGVSSMWCDTSQIQIGGTIVGPLVLTQITHIAEDTGLESET